MKKIIFFVSCFFIFMDVSLALTLTCPEVASPGEEISIRVEETEFNGVKVKYKFDSSFVYRDSKINSSWKSYYDGVNGVSVGNVNNSDKLLMDINLKVNMDAVLNKDYVLELVDIEGNNSFDKMVNLDNVSCKVRLVSDVNTLDSLVVDGVALSPKFDKNVVSYQGKTSNNSIVIKANLSDDSAKIEGDLGEKKLNLGVNNFLVKITSARGNVREYKIYITRVVDKKSSDVTLKSLTLSSGHINFDKNTFLYLVDVDYEVEDISVEAVLSDSGARVDIEKPDRLVVGENTIRIKVTAEDGTVGTYEVIVNRHDKLDIDASIRNLIIKNYEFNFDSNIYEYDLLIDGEDKLDIDVILNSNRAKYKIIGNNNLSNNSIIKIEVVAENGNILVYKIKIKMGESNSNAIINYIKIIPLVLFLSLGIVALILKLIKKKVVKK